MFFSPPQANFFGGFECIETLRIRVFGPPQAKFLGIWRHENVETKCCLARRRRIFFKTTFFYIVLKRSKMRFLARRRRKFFGPQIELIRKPPLFVPDLKQGGGFLNNNITDIQTEFINRSGISKNKIYNTISWKTQGNLVFLEVEAGWPHWNNLPYH